MASRALFDLVGENEADNLMMVNEDTNSENHESRKIDLFNMKCLQPLNLDSLKEVADKIEIRTHNFSKENLSTDLVSLEDILK